MNTLSYVIEQSIIALELGSVVRLTANVHVDGLPVLPLSHESPLDVLCLLAQGRDSGEIDLYTCSCGVAGCAGFHEGVTLTRGVNTMRWRLPREGYGDRISGAVAGGYDFEFSLPAYESTLSDLEASLLAVEAQAARVVISPTIGDEDFDNLPSIEILLENARRESARTIARRSSLEAAFTDLQGCGIALQLEGTRVFWMSLQQYAWAFESERSSNATEPLPVADIWGAAAAKLRADPISAVRGLCIKRVQAYACCYDLLAACWRLSEELPVDAWSRPELKIWLGREPI